MLLAYQRSIPTEYQQADIPLINPSPDGAAAALSVLRENGGLVLEGSQHDRLTIRDLILGFSSNLSRAILHRPKRNEIYGYEFMDIMMDSYKSELKMRHINRGGLAWISLLEQVNCLFCSNIGDVIRGFKGYKQDSPCNQLLKGCDWLAASMHSINELHTRHGGDWSLGTRRLSDHHLWLMKGSPFQKCEHGNESQVSCWESSELLQEIQTAPRRTVEQKCNLLEGWANAALVFRHLKRDITYICRLSMLNPRSEPPYREQSTQDSAALTLRTAALRQHDMSFALSLNGA